MAVVVMVTRKPKVSKGDEMADEIVVQTNGGNVDSMGIRRTNLAAAKLRLFLQSFVPTPASLQAAFLAAEATFTGYPAGGIVVTWSAVGVDAEGVATMIGSRSFFQATDAVTPNLIGGAWLETAAGLVEEYCVFQPPVDMTFALAWLGVTPIENEPIPSLMSVEN
jgi:hypothetical protein